MMHRKNLLQGWTGYIGHQEAGQAPHLVVKPGDIWWLLAILTSVTRIAYKMCIIKV